MANEKYDWPRIWKIAEKVLLEGHQESTNTLADRIGGYVAAINQLDPGHAPQLPSPHYLRRYMITKARKQLQPGVNAARFGFVLARWKPGYNGTGISGNQWTWEISFW